MTKLRLALAGFLALVSATAAVAQTFPTIPDRSLIGRLGTGTGSGPSQAIPFATFSAITGPSVTIENVGGGTTKTAAQNTAAINSAIAQGVRLIFGPGTYNYAPPLNINRDFVTFQGAGFGITNLSCNPTADGVCINVSNAVLGDINNTTFQNISLSSSDTTFKKMMIKATAQSGMVLDNVLIGASATGGTLTGGSGGSIGLYVLGHQFLRTKNVNIFAEQPLIFGKNPYSYISTDHYGFRDTYLIGATAQPLVRYEAGVTIFDNVFDTTAFVKGADGVFIDPSLAYTDVPTINNAGTGYAVGDTITIAGGTCPGQPVVVTVVQVSGGTITKAAISIVGSCSVLPGNPVSQASTSGAGSGAQFTLGNTTSRGLHVVNARFEQSVCTTCYSINANSQNTNPLNGLVIDNVEMSGNKGILARNTVGLSLKDVAYTPSGGVTEALNLDATVDPVWASGIKFPTGTTTTITGQNSIWTWGTPTGYAFAPTFGMSPTTNQLTTTGNIFIGAPGASTKAIVSFAGATSSFTPVVAQAAATGFQVILPNPAGANDTIVARNTTDTLTNKTLTSPVISTISNTGTLTLPTSTDTLVGRATTDTLTNKTINCTSGTNTCSNISTNTIVQMGTGNVCGAIAQNSTAFFGVGSCQGATESNWQWPASIATTAANLRVVVSSTPAAGQTYIFTLRKNGVDTTLTCTVSNPATTCSDTNAGHNVSFAAGDLINMKIVASVTAGNVAVTNTSITAITTSP